MRFAKMRSFIILLFFLGFSTTAFADLIKRIVTHSPLNAACITTSCTEKYHIERHHEYNKSVYLFRLINTAVEAPSRSQPVSIFDEFENTRTLENHHVFIASNQFTLNETTYSASKNTENYEFGLLFDAPGVEITYYTCIACHSERIIAQQGLSRKSWDEMLDWMVEEQGMLELDEQDRIEILDYLSTHYNEDRPNFPYQNKK